MNSAALDFERRRGERYNASRTFAGTVAVAVAVDNGDVMRKRVAKAVRE